MARPLFLLLPLLCAASMASASSSSSPLEVLPPSPPLTPCGISQLRWSGSSGQVGVVVTPANDSSTLLYAFDQQPAGTLSLTWAGVPLARGQSVAVHVVDGECRVASGGALRVGEGAQGEGAEAAQEGQECAASSRQQPQQQQQQRPPLFDRCNVNDVGSRNGSNTSSTTKTHSPTSSANNTTPSTATSTSTSNNSTTTATSTNTSGSSPPTPNACSSRPAPSAFLFFSSLLSALPSLVAAATSSTMSSPSPSPSPNPVSALLSLPPGFLPPWLLFVSLLASGNALSNYIDPRTSHRVYTSPRGHAQSSPLQARLFALWNLASAGIRAYAAYNVHVKAVYDLALGSFLLALAHFGSEVALYKTARIRSPGVISPLVVASLSSAVMVAQYGHYVQ